MERSEILRFLSDRPLGVVATVSPQGLPEAALVGFAVTDAFELIFDTRTAARKCVNLASNGRVAAVVGWDDGRTVQYEGAVAELSEPELARYKETYFAAFPDGRERERRERMTYVVVRPAWLRYCDHTKPEPLIVELSF
jgi:hypothetical protein